MKVIGYTEYKSIVESLGGSRSFNAKPSEDNYFIYFDHRVELYNVATVNDRCEAPERLYMDYAIAYAVRNELNRRIVDDDT